jgi:hypothetical protein
VEINYLLHQYLKITKQHNFNLQRFFLSLLVIHSFTACNNDKTSNQSSFPADSEKLISACDTFPPDTPEIRDPKKFLSSWLETTSLDWFLDKRQTVWREAITWGNKISPIDSNSIIKCLFTGKENISLYIPNHFYNKEKNGNRYSIFFIINNSPDTILIPHIDAMIENITS